jgi:hypothetical protein
MTVSSPYTVTTLSGSWASSASVDGTGVGTTRLNNVWGMAFTKDERFLLLAERFGHRIRRYDPATTVLSTVVGDGTAASTDAQPASAARINQPRGIARLSNGDFLVTDEGGHRIRVWHYSTRDAFLTYACVGTTTGPLTGEAYSVACDPPTEAATHKKGGSRRAVWQPTVTNPSPPAATPA